MTRRGALGGPLAVAPRRPPSEPDISEHHKAAVIAALRWAWAKVRKSHVALLRTGPEEDITTELQRLLNERRNGRRLVPHLVDFETVSRGENQRTSDGRNSKKPDLTFRPPAYQGVVDGTSWGWFVECKLVGGTKSVGLYVGQGLERFCVGEYGAKMPSGAMLAYVRGPCRPASALTGKFGQHSAQSVLRARTRSDECETDHPRGHLVPPCVDITLTHLWLSVP